MRHFLFYSNTIRTDGNFKDLKKSGRVDIAIHSIIHAFFISNGLRKDVIFDLFLNGPPVAPRLVRIQSNIDTPWSKKDIATLLSISLKKYNKDKRKNNPFPGVTVYSYKLEDLIQQYLNENKVIYILDPSGDDIKNLDIPKNVVFVLGDFLGIPKKEKKYLKDKGTFVSVGNIPYFTSQVIAVLNWLYDQKYDAPYWDTSKKFKL